MGRRLAGALWLLMAQQYALHRSALLQLRPDNPSPAAPSTAWYRASPFTAMMRSRLRACYGIDIGGTKIELVAFHDDEHGLREVHRERIPTPGTDFAEFVQSMQALVARADVELDMRAAVGIGLPGVVDTVSGRQLSSNVPALTGRVVASALQQRCSGPGNRQ
jgi:hypothetical protein